MRAVLPLVGLAVLLVLVPQLWIKSEYQLDIARMALYSACLTITWSLLAGVAGQFSFAHVALAGIAAYSGALWGRAIPAAIPVVGSVWFSIVVGAVASLVTGTILGAVVLGLRGAYLALFTLAFGEITRLVVIAEKEVTGGWLSLGIAQLPGGSRLHYYLMLGLLAALLAGVYSVIRSRIGLFLRAMREDFDVAAAMGVDTTRLKILIFSLTAFLVGLCGAIYFHTVPRLTPGIFDLLEMGFIVVYAVVGGLEKSPSRGNRRDGARGAAGGATGHRNRSLSLRAWDLALCRLRRDPGPDPASGAQRNHRATGSLVGGCPAPQHDWNDRNRKHDRPDQLSRGAHQAARHRSASRGA